MRSVDVMRAIVLALAAASLLWLGGGSWSETAIAAADAPMPGAQYMRELARDRGCTTCHRETSTPAKDDSALAMAPSWQDIAARYRNVPDARAHLAALVLTGSDPNDRHWKNHAAFDRMMANEIATTPQEADLLVRWILSLR